MSIKETLENHPVILLFGVLIAGFGSGVGAVSYLEAREDKLRQEIIENLKSENQNLAKQTAELEQSVRESILKYIDEKAIQNSAPFGGENSLTPKLREEIVLELNKSDSGELANIIRDPIKNLNPFQW